jgi:hypothetical protein
LLTSITPTINNNRFVGFEAFTAMTMKTAVFWGVASCRCGRLNRRFGVSYRLHLQGRKIRERPHLHGATPQKTAFFNNRFALIIGKQKMNMILSADISTFLWQELRNWKIKFGECLPPFSSEKISVSTNLKIKIYGTTQLEISRYKNIHLGCLTAKCWQQSWSRATREEGTEPWKNAMIVWHANNLPSWNIVSLSLSPSLFGSTALWAFAAFSVS